MSNVLDPSSGKLDWRKYWQVLCRRRWWLALPAFAIWMAFWALAWFLPAVYRSETVILVEQQKIPEQYVVPNVADLQDRLQSMTQQILSRTRLLQVIEDFDLYSTLRGHITEDELVERMRNKDIQVDSVESPNHHGDLTAFKVAYLSKDPALAQKVTTKLTSLFIDENLQARQEQSEQTTKFLDAQLDDARRGLANQEAKVKEFKSQYLGQLPEQLQSNVQILAGLQAQLEQQTDLLGKAKQQSVYLETLQAQWRSLETNLRLGNTADAAVPPALQQDLTQLRAQLADLRSHYTDRHPDVRKLKDQIAKTEKLKQQAEAQIAEASSSPSADATTPPNNPVDLQALSLRMDVESQVKANKVEIVNRQRAIEELQRRVEEYQSRLNLTPVREQQLAGLTRDYEQSQKNYEQLLAKRNQSEMATDLEKRQQGQQFRVLDPPNLPQKPYSPNRLELNLIGLAAGLFVGAFLLVGVEIVNDNIYSEEELTPILSAPVLTEIPRLTTAAEAHGQVRAEWRQRAALIAMVVFTAAGFTSTYLFG
jgi:polysaccharide chain length determinant protein (PEP-CTERM system associated)